MAKSLRSKRKRMFRNIKRKRYAVKELIRLKNMLGLPVTEAEAVVPPLHVVEYNFKKQSKTIKEPINDRWNLDFKFTEKGTLIPIELSDDEAEEMNSESEGEHKPKEGETEVNESQGQHASKEGETEMDHSEKKVYDRKTMKDKSGNYPPWFTQKDVKKQAKKNRLKKQIIKKKEILRAINEKKNKKFIRRKPKKRMAKQTTEENSKETTEGKFKIVEQSNSDEKQSMKMEL